MNYSTVAHMTLLYKLYSYIMEDNINCFVDIHKMYVFHSLSMNILTICAPSNVETEFLLSSLCCRC